MLNVQIIRNKIEEISAIGFAYMAGLATAYWKDIEERSVKKIFKSNMSFERR